MAYQQEFSEEEDNKKGQAPTVSGTSESVLPSNSGSAPTASSASPMKKGSGFTNLSTYVNANRDQAGDLSNRVTSGVESQVQGAKGLQESYRKAADSALGGVQTEDNGVMAAFSTPNLFKSKEYQDRYLNQTKGYTGPSAAEGIQGYNEASQATAKARGLASGLENPENVGQAIKSAPGVAGQYTQGQGILDSFLATSGKGAENLANYKADYAARNPLGGFESSVGQVGSSIESKRTAANDLASRTKGMADASLKDLVSSLTAKQNQVNAERTNAQTEASRLSQGLASNDESVLRSLGFSPAEIISLRNQGFDSSRLINAPSSYRGLGDVAGADQANYEGLLNLFPGTANQFNFSKTGASAPVVSTNESVRQAAAQAASLEKAAAERLAALKSSRGSEYDSFISGVGSGDAAIASKLGMTPAQLKEASDRGLLGGLINRGADVNEGDVATDAERASWASLASSLGLNTSGRFADSNQEGSAVNVNQEAVNNVIKVLQEEQRKREEEAARLKAAADAEALRKAQVSGANVGSGNYSGFGTSGINIGFGGFR